MKQLLLLLFALTATPALADDFGLWTSAEVQKDLSKKFSLDGGIGFRAEDKLRQASRWDFSLGATYKPVRFLSISAGYSFIHDYSPTEVDVNYNSEGERKGYNVDHAYWRNKHRAVFNITGKVDWGRFTFSLRERYQYTHYMEADTYRDRYRSSLPENQDISTWTGNPLFLAPDGLYYVLGETAARTKKAKDRHYLRSRVQVEYNIRHCPWTPYASYELSNNLSEQLHLDKMRLTVGAEWKITKQHRLDLAYVYDNGQDDDTNSDIHAISVGYKFKF